MPETFAAKKRAWASRPAILNTHHRIMLDDARELAAREPDESVHLVVTSPPCWNLKRYPHDRGGAQLGHVDDRKAFLAGLVRV